jgi:hypothetical protein
MQQDYVDTFNALDLPIYPGPIVSGKLLDWVGQGVYGMARPAIGSGVPLQVGPLNTWGCNMPGHSMAVINAYFQYEDWLPSTVNGLAQLSVGDVVITDDDTYRRILSWHFFKGDGKYFSTRWLKRRVWRFCYNMNGIPNDIVVDPISQDFEYKYIADTGQISISLGVNRNCTIRFVLGIRTVTGGEMLDTFGCNGFGVSIGAHTPDHKVICLNELRSIYHPLPALPFMDVFKKSVDSGALELPYQYNYTVHIG